jgi:hypothetical protein
VLGVPFAIVVASVLRSDGCSFSGATLSHVHGPFKRPHPNCAFVGPQATTVYIDSDDTTQSTEFTLCLGVRGGGANEEGPSMSIHGR